MSPIETVAETALTTAANLVPTLASADPKVAAVVALTPLALQLLQVASAARDAGLISDDQLSAAWVSSSQRIQSAHNQWTAMNAADAANAARAAAVPATVDKPATAYTAPAAPAAAPAIGQPQ